MAGHINVYKNVEAMLDKLHLDGILEDDEAATFQKIFDEHNRFKEFIDTMHHLMAQGFDVMSDEEFVLAAGGALKKADPDYYK